MTYTPEQLQELVNQVELLVGKARNQGWWMGFGAACATVLVVQLLMSWIIKRWI